MTDAEYTAAVEALLFLHGEALSAEKMASFLKSSTETVRSACERLSEQYADSQRGLLLVEKGDSYQITTKPAFGGFLEEFVKEGLKEDLTSAALETLSLVAYFGPITRAHIDFVRGVNSSFTLRNLLIRGLIERTFTKGNVYSYTVTFDFLRHVGLGRPSELPRYEEYKKLREQLIVQQSGEIESGAKLVSSEDVHASLGGIEAGSDTQNKTHS